MSTRRLLRYSASYAGREIAARQVQIWLKAHRTLRAQEDPGALHDFRVALRRLRSTLRAFRPYLVHPKGLRRRLRRLARTTNDSRNLEIWREWVGAQAPKLTLRQRPGMRWLQRRLAVRQEHANALMQRRIEKWLPRIREDLARVRSGTGHPRKLPLGSQTARAGVARVLRAGARALAEQLARVHSMQDRESAHAARISAKRLRYLLEPLKGEITGAAKVLRQLEALQTVLGEVHDAHIFADELRAALAEAGEQRARSANRRLLPWPGAGGPTAHAAPSTARTGLLALAERLREDGNRRFHRLQKEWLRSGADRLIRDLSALTRRVANRGGRI